MQKKNKQMGKGKAQFKTEYDTKERLSRFIANNSSIIRKHLKKDRHQVTVDDALSYMLDKLGG